MKKQRVRERERERARERESEKSREREKVRESEPVVCRVDTTFDNLAGASREMGKTEKPIRES